jgi:8-oxo-dGTP pyrophosphatase MutT (NUDIX family)
MKKYVLIHARLKDKNKILLILKDRPHWQKNRLNLVGGKVEEDELEVFAAMRELKEESGLSGYIPTFSGTIFGINSIIYCYFVDVLEEEIKPRECETELVEWYDLSKALADPRLIPNLKIIIPLLQLGITDWTIVDNNFSLDAFEQKFTVTLQYTNFFVDKK